MRPDPANTSDAAKSILALDVNTVARMLEEKFPATWRRMHTKSIQAPHIYYSSKSLPVGLTGTIEEMRSLVNDGKQLDSNVGIIAGILERYNFPLYYVSSPLMEALKHSHPPAGLTWAQLTLPFQAICFMIPRGSLIEPEPTKGEIICIGVARLPAGEPLIIPTVCKIENMPETRLSVFWMIGPSALVNNDVTFPETHPLEPLSEWIDSRTEISGRQYIGPRGGFSSYVAGLVANFILVMGARKELVEPGRRIAKATRTGRPDIYSPTFIGRNYAVLRKDSGDRQGHFTELGWRAGHFKRQHFGPKNEQTKTIFVDPYIAFTRGLEPV
jgi:hypothetical protein